MQRPRNLRQFVKAVGFRTRNRKRRGPGGLPAFVEPPRGPLPLSSGAAAPLEFDD
jgi:hypothetical protein